MAMFNSKLLVYQTVMKRINVSCRHSALLGHLVIPGSSLIHEDEAHHLTWFTQQTDMDSMLKIGAAWWCNKNLEKYYLECVYVYIYI